MRALLRFREVRERCEGLVCLTGGDEGPLAAALERGGMDEGRRLLRSLVQTFGPNTVFTSNCNAIASANRKPATKPQFSLSRESFSFPFLRRTASTWRRL